MRFLARNGGARGGVGGLVRRQGNGGDGILITMLTEVVGGAAAEQQRGARRGCDTRTPGFG